MKKAISINKKVAPSNWLKFRRWFKAACNLPMSAEEAFNSLGYKVPVKNGSKRAKKKVE